MELNQIVTWRECSPSVPAQTSRIRGLSPCGKYALIDWVSTPVSIEDLTPAELRRPYPYSPHRQNNWLLTGMDLATGQNLLAWVEDHEQGTDDGRDIARVA